MNTQVRNQNYINYLSFFPRCNFITTLQCISSFVDYVVTTMVYCYINLKKITILMLKLNLNCRNNKKVFFSIEIYFSFVWNSQRTGRSILQSQRKIFCLRSTQNQRSIMVSENLKWITICCLSKQKLINSFHFCLGLASWKLFTTMIWLDWLPKRLKIKKASTTIKNFINLTSKTFKTFKFENKGT
jgi:hypothetical protein